VWVFRIPDRTFRDWRGPDEIDRDEKKERKNGLSGEHDCVRI